ncbi:MAG: SDR family NAD(P)-dependent oxidoreductase, partial [Pseudomonadota bacterium]
MSAVLVTGAAKRIGRAFALALAADGRPVAIHCHRSRAEAAALADTIAAAGGTATVIVGDLAEPGAVAALIPTAATALGPITAVVNSASSFVFDDLATLAPATFERQMRVNLLAPLLLSRDLVAQLPPGSVGNGKPTFWSSRLTTLPT